jgi:hypothetical protein
MQSTLNGDEKIVQSYPTRSDRTTKTLIALDGTVQQTQ